MSQKKADKAAGSAAKSPRPKNAWEEQEAEPDVEEKGEEELLGSSLVQELDDVEDKPAPETTDEIVPKKEKTRSKKKKNAAPESEEDDAAVEVTEKKAYGILMKPNERNTTKSVTFDEDRNIVKEFSKTAKIEKGKPPSYRKDSSDKRQPQQAKREEKE